MPNPTFLEQASADLESLRRDAPPRARIVTDLVRAAHKIDAMQRADDFSVARYPLIHLAALAQYLAESIREDG